MKLATNPSQYATFRFATGNDPPKGLFHTLLLEPEWFSFLRFHPRIKEGFPFVGSQPPKYIGQEGEGIPSSGKFSSSSHYYGAWILASPPVLERVLRNMIRRAAAESFFRHPHSPPHHLHIRLGRVPTHVSETPHRKGDFRMYRMQSAETLGGRQT